MSKLSNKALDFVRHVSSTYNTRPLGTLLVINQQYPNATATYTVTVDATTVVFGNGTSTYSVTYTNKSSSQVAQELSNSPYPLFVKALADVQQLSANELLVSGSVIPTSFDVQDRTLDGKGVIIRCARYAVTYDNTTALTLKAPYSSQAIMPWWIRITNGNFSQRYNGSIYHFSLPEYKDQIWSTTAGKPYIDVEGEVANFIAPHAIKLARAPILWKNNILFTSSVGDVVYTSSMIQDVDTINGIIYLKPDISVNKNLLVWYTYYENSFLYKGINLNGHFSQNPYILNKYVVFYALPTKSSSGIHRSRAITHAIGSSIYDAIFNITADDPSEPICIIGAVNVQSSASADDLSVVDTRTFGGGLRTDELGIATQKRFKESQYFFDIGTKEGIPYPGTAALVVELPAALKEVLSVSEIRDRAKRFIAAGVYPIVKLQDETYYDQFAITDYNSDISLVDYTFAVSNTGSLETIYGQTGQAAGILNNNMQLPTGLFQGVYDVTGCRPNPWLSNDSLLLYPGDEYRVSFLKGSADATFSYEWKAQDGSWERVTVSNTVPVSGGQLSTQSFLLEAQYGYKEIRNLTGSSAYIMSDSFTGDALTSIARIIGYTNQLSDGVSVTGELANVYTMALASRQTGIALDSLIKPIMVNYDTMQTQGFYSYADIPVLNGASNRFYTQVAAYGWPVSGYNGTYNAIDDIHSYARYAHGRINEEGDSAALVLTGSNSWYSTNSSYDATYAYSGALLLANKVLTISPWSGNGSIGSDVITPFYTPATNTKVNLSSPYGRAEISNDNNLHLGSQYIKAFAALYSTQVGIWTGNYSPRNIALSGMASWASYFSNYFDSPTYNGTGVNHSWVTTFNRISTFASTCLDSVCNGFDYIYYGNDTWAGWTGVGTKYGVYYDPTFNNNTNLTKDYSWTDTIVWPDSDALTATESLARVVTSVDNILVSVEPLVRSNAVHGGIIQPGYFKFMKYLMWAPLHAALEEPLFSGQDFTRHVDTFEYGMAAALKGSLNEDGILVEGGSYKYQMAPFSGTLPNEMFDACVMGYQYYNAIGDTRNTNKWLAITEGLYRTTEALYAQSGGYPYGPYYNLSTASGDPGSTVLNGYLQFLNLLHQPLTSDELSTVTGQIVDIF